MENSDKKIDLKVKEGLRNEFICKKCNVFPRPGVKLMRCCSCTELLCQNCCRFTTKCPLCLHESKEPKISTFIEESKLKKRDNPNTRISLVVYFFSAIFTRHNQQPSNQPTQFLSKHPERGRSVRQQPTALVSDPGYQSC